MAQLKKPDRKEIEYFINKGYKPGQVAKILKKPRSTIKREIDNNSVKGKYIADKAHLKAYQRRYWVMTDLQKIRGHPALEAYIEASLRRLNPWSPEQIAGSWNEGFSAEQGYTISAPTIYKYLYRFRLDLCISIC